MVSGWWIYLISYLVMKYPTPLICALLGSFIPIFCLFFKFLIHVFTIVRRMEKVVITFKLVQLQLGSEDSRPRCFPNFPCLSPCCCQCCVEHNTNSIFAHNWRVISDWANRTLSKPLVYSVLHELVHHPVSIPVHYHSLYSRPSHTCFNQTIQLGQCT